MGIPEMREGKGMEENNGVQQVPHEEEKLSAMIGIRIRPSGKREFQEMAVERGETLSEFLWELIEAGLDVKQQDRDERNVEQKD